MGMAEITLASFWFYATAIASGQEPSLIRRYKPTNDAASQIKLEAGKILKSGEEDIRELEKQVNVYLYDLSEECGKNGWWHPRCEEEKYRNGSAPITYCTDETFGVTSAKKLRIKWKYTVRTNTDEFKSKKYLEDDVCDALQGVLDVTIEKNCDRRRRRRLSDRRRLGIHGYSNITCNYVGSCGIDGDKASCTVYEGSIDIVYGDDNISAGDVIDTVGNIAKDALEGDDIKDEINGECETEVESCDAVTDVSFGAPDEDPEVTAGIVSEKLVDDEDGLSMAAKITIAVASALVALLLLFCCWRRHVMRNKNEKDLYASNAATSPSEGADDGSYRTSDLNNPGLHHSKLDVHRCPSDTCECCNPSKVTNSASVFFVSTQDAPLNSIVKDNCKDVVSDQDAQERQQEDNGKQQKAAILVSSDACSHTPLEPLAVTGAMGSTHHVDDATKDAEDTCAIRSRESSLTYGETASVSHSNDSGMDWNTDDGSSFQDTKIKIVSTWFSRFEVGEVATKKNVAWFHKQRETKAKLSVKSARRRGASTTKRDLPRELSGKSAAPVINMTTTQADASEKWLSPRLPPRLTSKGVLSSITLAYNVVTKALKENQNEVVNGVLAADDEASIVESSKALKKSRVKFRREHGLCCLFLDDMSTSFYFCRCLADSVMDESLSYCGRTVQHLIESDHTMRNESSLVSAAGAVPTNERGTRRRSSEDLDAFVRLSDLGCV